MSTVKVADWNWVHLNPFPEIQRGLVAPIWGCSSPGRGHCVCSATSRRCCVGNPIVGFQSSGNCHLVVNLLLQKIQGFCMTGSILLGDKLWDPEAIGCNPKNIKKHLYHPIFGARKWKRFLVVKKGSEGHLLQTLSKPPTGASLPGNWYWDGTSIQPRDIHPTTETLLGPPKSPGRWSSPWNHRCGKGQESGYPKSAPQKTLTGASPFGVPNRRCSIQKTSEGLDLVLDLPAFINLGLQHELATRYTCK